MESKKRKSIGFRAAFGIFFIVDNIVVWTLGLALPSSSMFSLMCKDNGNEAADYAAQAAIITVFASMGTLPLVAWILR